MLNVKAVMHKPQKIRNHTSGLPDPREVTANADQASIPQHLRDLHLDSLTTGSGLRVQTASKKGWLFSFQGPNVGVLG